MNFLTDLFDFSKKSKFFCQFFEKYWEFEKNRFASFRSENGYFPRKIEPTCELNLHFVGKALFFDIKNSNAFTINLKKVKKKTWQIAGFEHVTFGFLFPVMPTHLFQSRYHRLCRLEHCASCAISGKGKKRRLLNWINSIRKFFFEEEQKYITDIHLFISWTVRRSQYYKLI